MKLKKIMMICLLIVSISLVMGFEDVVRAEVEYPTDDIRVVVPYGAGGGQDTLTRTVARYIELEENFIVDNISGAGGQIGTEAVLGADPDGYTLLSHAMGIVIGYYAGLFEEPIWREFEPIAALTVEDSAISARIDAPFDTLEEFIEYAKENPNVVSWGYAGVGGTTHTTTAAFTEELGLEVNEVPYPGAANTTAAIAGGHVDVIVTQPSEILDLLHDGQVKMLATTGTDRNPAVPEVPTMVEKGIDFEFQMWRGFFAPKGTPDEIINKLETALQKVVENEEFQESMETLNYGIRFLGSEEFGKQMEEDANWLEEIKHVYE